MEAYVKQNKRAWEFDAYNFWVSQGGSPEERARLDKENPRAMLKRFNPYLDEVEHKKIAVICGSCGKKAVPLAILGAEVTVFDLSEANARYARETAGAAGVELNYIVGDVYEIDLSVFGGVFDIVFMEGGVLHYFHHLGRFMAVMNALLKTDGRMICSDFHPFNKIMDTLGFGTSSYQPGDYFSEKIQEGEMAHARFYGDETRRQMPKCFVRRFTASEIINAAVDAGFIVRRFDELPSWADEKLPGEFVLVADKA